RGALLRARARQEERAGDGELPQQPSPRAPHLLLRQAECQRRANDDEGPNLAGRLAGAVGAGPGLREDPAAGLRPGAGCPVGRKWAGGLAVGVVAVALAVAGFFVPCPDPAPVSFSNYQRVRLGMSQEDVRALLGPPGTHFTRSPHRFWDPIRGWTGPYVSEGQLISPIFWD